MPKIIVISNNEEKDHELGPVSTIGRHPDNSIQLLDRIVSKEHAQIIRQPDGSYLFRDLGSLNGSFFKDERVSDHLLSEGDEIVMGAVRLVYRGKVASPAPAQQVTIENSTETMIRQTIKAEREDQDFLPEARITDLDVLRRDYERLRMAHELGVSIGLEVNLDVLLDKIITKSFDLLTADRGVILLLEDTTGRGHRSRNVVKRTRRSIFITLD